MINKIKIIVVGLPRSGTTVLSNYINSYKNAFCFIEPHWEFQLYKKKSFFKDNKLKGIHFLRYYKNKERPLDNAINKIQKRYDIVGFKETFRSSIYKNFNEIIPNDELINDYLKNNYRLISIIRNPINVWNSYKSSNPPYGSWTADINCFIFSYKEFFEIINNSLPIIYESFIINPEVELLKKTRIRFIGMEYLITRETKMGDKDANRAIRIQERDKSYYFTKKEEKIIKDSKAMLLYNNMVEKSRVIKEI